MMAVTVVPSCETAVHSTMLFSGDCARFSRPRSTARPARTVWSVPPEVRSACSSRANAAAGSARSAAIASIESRVRRIMPSG